MKLFNISILIFAFILLSCEDSENQTNNSNNANNTNNVNNSNVTVDYDHTTCKTNLKSMVDYQFAGFECIYYSYDGAGNLFISHINAIFNCCPDETLGLTGDLVLNGNSITVTESDNGGMCSCMCPYDLNYTLTGIEAGNYTAVFNTYTGGSVSLDLTAAGEGTACVDKLADAFICNSAGERGCLCEDSADCMDGNGYCYHYSEYNSSCVNTCETTEDCPMPDLEECLEDADGIYFCSPTSSFE